jgi:hypothetical protein
MVTDFPVTNMHYQKVCYQILVTEIYVTKIRYQEVSYQILSHKKFPGNGKD